MSSKRLTLIFSDQIETDTFDNFAVVLELFSAVYRTAERTLVILSDPSKTEGLQLQLAVWQQDGAVQSWTASA